jgi:hypothetical protein
MEKKVSKADGETLTCMKCSHRVVVTEPEEAALA